MRVMFAGDRGHDRDEGRRAALRAGLECTATDCVPLADIRLRLAREPEPHIIVVDLGDHPEAAAASVRAAVEGVKQPVFAVVHGRPASSLDAAALGVRAVWEPTAVREGLLAAANLLRKMGQVPDTRGRVVVVAAAHPGAGVTTVASGLAFALAQAKAGTVALVELTNATPEVALNLDLQPTYCFGDLIRESDRADVSMLRHAAVPHAAGVAVLAYSPETLVPEEVTPGLARDFHILLRSGFAWSVVDAGFGISPGTVALLAEADSAVIVTRLDPASLRLTRRYLARLAEREVPVEHVLVVANRYNQSGLVHWKKAEEALRRKVAAWLPDNPAAINAALRVGQPLVSATPRCGVHRQLKELVATLKKRFTTVRR
jgi:pilus assembly protein CpaE